MHAFGMDDLQKAVDNGLLRQLRLLTGALAAAPLIYAGMAYWSVTQSVAPQFAEPIFVGMLCLVSMGSAGMAWWLPEWTLKRRDFRQLAEKGLLMPKGGGLLTDKPAILGAIIRQYFLTRLAMVEAVAVYGLLVAFISAGSAHIQPLYYLTLLPCLAVSALFFTWMPDELSLRAFFEEKILKHPSNLL